MSLLVGLSASGCYEGSSVGASGTDSGASNGTGPASASDTEGSGSETGDPPPGAACAGQEVQVGLARMRLLTRYEYDNTVLALLGDPSAPAQTFPPENQSTAFENNAGDHQVTKDTVRRYLDVAEDLAATARTAGFQTLTEGTVPCELATGDAACGSAFITGFGRRAFRRPLEPDEQALFETLFTSEFEDRGFEEALEITLQAIMQSPQFLYRIEMLPAGASVGEVVAVSDYEAASRLSYFLAATTPDDALLDAAAAGELHTPEQLEAQARRILETPEARLAVRQFHRQWLGLSALQSVTKDPAAFPGLALDTAAADWSQSVQDFSEHIVFDGGGTFDDLLQSDAVFLSPQLAEFYGATPNGDGSYAMPGERAGLLTQPALMALYAYPDRSSPIARGVWVRQRMLCQTLPPPPDDVDIEPPSVDPDATTREQFAEHTSEPACAGCHVLIDPLGFPFEHYDAVGRWRTEENGLAIDASGEFSGVTDEDLIGPVDDAVEMAGKLAESSDFRDCATEQWFTFALGRLPDEVADECSLLQASEVVAESGDIRDLLVAIVVSDAFRYRVVDGGEG